MKRQVPKMTTDEEAEAFLDTDLSDLDFGQFRPVHFDFGSSKPSRLEPGRSVHLPPGTPAPYSGIYRETGPRGGRPGGSVTIDRGKPLPPASGGRRWTLVDQARHKNHN
jgi:hypothetical protein